MIVVYATTKDGDGHCKKIDEFESIEDIRIQIGDVVITFCEEEEEGVKDDKRNW